MALASGTRTQLTYVAEVTQGVTPTTPVMKILRATGRNINLQKNMLETAEIRSDRTVADLRHGFNQVSGSIPFELGHGSYDDMIEGAMSGTWAAPALAGAPNLGSAGSTPGLFTRTDAGSFVADGFRPGQLITTTGFSSNNGTFLVLDVLDGTITVAETTTLEAADAGRDITSTNESVDVGLVLRTFSFERGFLDVNQFQVFRGVAVNMWEQSIQPESMVTGTFGLVGMAADPLSGTTLDADPTAAPTNSPFSAFEGALHEGNGAVELAVVTGLNFTLENGRVLEAVIGSKTSPEVFEGTARISGTMTAFFEDAVLLNKFINETESSLLVKLDDINGSDHMAVSFPRIKYTGGDIDPPQEGPVPVSLPFRALLDQVTATYMTVTRSVP